MLDYSFSDGITLIILKNVPSDLCYVTGIFEAFAEDGINIDMISQSPPQGSTSSLSFTVSDESLADALNVISKLREVHPDLKTAVSSGNYKVTVFGEEMKSENGIAAKVFKIFAEQRSDVRLITTSDFEISILISQPDIETIEKVLKQSL